MDTNLTRRLLFILLLFALNGALYQMRPTAVSLEPVHIEPLRAPDLPAGYRQQDPDTDYLVATVSEQDIITSDVFLEPVHIPQKTLILEDATLHVEPGDILEAGDPFYILEGTEHAVPSHIRILSITEEGTQKTLEFEDLSETSIHVDIPWSGSYPQRTFSYRSPINTGELRIVERTYNIHDGTSPYLIKRIHTSGHGFLLQDVPVEILDTREDRVFISGEIRAGNKVIKVETP